MAKLFVICGHGAGDPGACANGFQEATQVRKLAQRMAALGGADVQIGDMNRNWYADNGIGKGHCPAGVPVIELHMDSAAAGAKGGHVIIKAGFNADAYDNALAKFIGEFFPGRSKTIVGRSDLANPNRAAAKGVNYRLVECGFISNADDARKFDTQIDALAKGILACFGISANGGGTPAPKPQPPTQGGGSTQTGYVATVTADVLNIRKGAGTNYGIAGTVKKGEAYTIVAERAGAGSKNGWGKLKSGAGWVSLDFMKRKGASAPSPQPPKPRVTVDGLWGNATTKALQSDFGTPVDGVVSGQDTINKKYHVNCTQGWQYGRGGSKLIIALQKKTGSSADGHFGPNSIKALQRFLGVSADGYCGPDTVKALQNAINAGKFK